MANNLAAFNAQAWSKRLIERLNAINVMKRLCNTNYEGELQNIGDTVQVRTVGNITLNTYTKNSTTISYQDLAPAKEPFQISDASYFAFNVDDVDKAQNDIAAMDKYLERAVVTINDAIDIKIATKATTGLTGNNTLSATAAGTGAAPGAVTVSNGAVTAIALGTAGSGYGTSPPIVTITGGGGTGARAHAVLTAGAVSSYVVDYGGINYTSAPTATAAGGVPIVLDSGSTAATSVYSAFVNARAALSKNNVPSTGRWAVVDPDTTSLLLSDTAHFVRSTAFGDSVVTDGNIGGNGSPPGYIGRCAGFSVYESNHLVASTVGGVAAKTLLFGDNLAISYAAQILEIEMLRLQTSFADACRGLLLHDAIVFAECSKRLVGVLAKA